jgi:hypothetical protein
VSAEGCTGAGAAVARGAAATEEVDPAGSAAAVFVGPWLAEGVWVGLVVGVGVGLGDRLGDGVGVGVTVCADAAHACAVTATRSMMNATERQAMSLASGQGRRAPRS